MIMRAYYSAPICQFLSEIEKPELILGILTSNSDFDVDRLQIDAWKQEIDILKAELIGFGDGHIFFEYTIPRMGERADVILIINGVIYVLEFKVHKKKYLPTDINQPFRYALDLKYFHEQSRYLSIIPILIATEGQGLPQNIRSYDDCVYDVIKANGANLQSILKNLSGSILAPALDPIAWECSSYKPTPTIIEAAQVLFRTHTVKDITRRGAEEKNLTQTSDAISNLIDISKDTGKKTIIFVTGVPGAGKTLAGLNITSERQEAIVGEHAIFLSGNLPLVKVLRESLVRDNINRIPSNELTKHKKHSIESEVKSFIQPMHEFRNEMGNQVSLPPHEKIIVFDEAQRAWTREKLAKHLKRNNSRGNRNAIADNISETLYGLSEPEFLLEVMDRFTDWAVIICLVGGGQEIHDGEAGILEWFRALKKQGEFGWRVAISPSLHNIEYLGNESISSYITPGRLIEDNDLHLAVSIRSYRSEKVSTLVKAILDNDVLEATSLNSIVMKNYPILLTRDLTTARKWLINHSRKIDRIGLLASSGGMRLRPEGLNIRAKVDVVSWFLNPDDDVRSSYYLEEAATEFDVQGLELDWACVAWDADLRYVKGSWDLKNFKGTKWFNVKEHTLRRYLFNTYRVLLTRARQGMVIFVPHGDNNDHTRLPEFYDGTFEYLKSIGFPEI